MKVLLSIKPKYADKIFSGEKKWEYRKKIWTREGVDFVEVYASAPISKVIGQFQIVTIQREYRRDIWWTTGEESGISFKEFKEYFKHSFYGYAIKICNPELYGIPRDLKRAYGIKRPPQNFMYL
jgi:predicted transcriptional regulator